MALIEPLPDLDRALWAVAFYAGLRRGEIQALRACDIDLGASLIRVERGWDQEEGAIEQSVAGRRTVPLLAILRDYLDEHLLRTGRTGEALVFGRTAADPFVPSTIDNRAQECWEAAGLEGITLHEARHTFASLLIDSGANAKAGAGVHGALEDPDDLRRLRAPAPGQPRRGPRADGRLPAGRPC